METRRNEDSDQHQIDLGRHLRDPDDYTARRSMKQGGFCEVLTLYYSKYYPEEVYLLNRLNAQTRNSNHVDLDKHLRNSDAKLALVL